MTTKKKTASDKATDKAKPGMGNFELTKLKRKTGASRQKVKKIQRQFYIRPPRGGVWFRTWKVEEPVEVALVKHPESGDLFIIHPDLEELVEGWSVVGATLIPYQTRNGGNIMIWPVKQPDGGQADSWYETAAEAASLGYEVWTKIVANMADGVYDITVAENYEKAPEWPDMSYEEIVTKAIQSIYVADENHEIFSDMRGEFE